MTLDNRKAIEIKSLTLTQDETIEWILKNSKEETEFRIYKSRYHATISLDMEKPNKQEG